MSKEIRIPGEISFSGEPSFTDAYGLLGLTNEQLANADLESIVRRSDESASVPGREIWDKRSIERQISPELRDAAEMAKEARDGERIVYKQAIDAVFNPQLRYPIDLGKSKTETEEIRDSLVYQRIVNQENQETELVKSFEPHEYGLILATGILPSLLWIKGKQIEKKHPRLGKGLRVAAVAFLTLGIPTGVAILTGCNSNVPALEEAPAPTEAPAEADPAVSEEAVTDAPVTGAEATPTLPIPTSVPETFGGDDIPGVVVEEMDRLNGYSQGLLTEDNAVWEFFMNSEDLVNDGMVAFRLTKNTTIGGREFGPGTLVTYNSGGEVVPMRQGGDEYTVNYNFELKTFVQETADGKILQKLNETGNWEELIEWQWLGKENIMVVDGIESSIQFAIGEDMIFGEGYQIELASPDAVKAAHSPIITASKNVTFAMEATSPGRIAAMEELLKNYDDLWVEPSVTELLSVLFNGAWELVKEEYNELYPDGGFEELVAGGIRVILVNHNNSSTPPKELTMPIGYLRTPVYNRKSDYIYWMGFSDKKLTVAIPLTENTWRASSFGNPDRHPCSRDASIGKYFANGLIHLTDAMSPVFLAKEWEEGKAPECIIDENRRECSSSLEGIDRQILFKIIPTGEYSFGIPAILVNPQHID